METIKYGDLEVTVDERFWYNPNELLPGFSLCFSCSVRRCPVDYERVEKCSGFKSWQMYTQSEIIKSLYTDFKDEDIQLEYRTLAKLEIPKTIAHTIYNAT